MCLMLRPVGSLTGSVNRLADRRLHLVGIGLRHDPVEVEVHGRLVDAVEALVVGESKDAIVPERARLIRRELSRRGGREERRRSRERKYNREAHVHHSFSLQLVVRRSGISETLLAPVESERRRELGTTVENQCAARSRCTLEGTPACGCRSAECSCADCWSTGASLQRLPRAQQSREPAKGSPQGDLFRCPNGETLRVARSANGTGVATVLGERSTWVALALPRPLHPTSFPVRGFARSHLG